MTLRLHQLVVCPTVIGRAAEMTALREGLEQAAHGQGGVVLLAGEAGVGKSRLVAELQWAASAQAFQLLRGQCFPADRSCPYAPLLDLLRAFLAPLSPAEIAAALGPSARALFPLLPEQARHLPGVAGLPPLSRLRLLLTYRSDEVGEPLPHWLAQLDRERLRREITLARLTRAAEQAQALAAPRAMVGQWTRALHSNSGRRRPQPATGRADKPMRRWGTL